MKIRIRGNSIRIRITKSEVEALTSDGIISSHVNFPGGKKLTYEVISSTLESNNKLNASFSDDKISISIDCDAIENWQHNDIIGFSETLMVDGNSLSLLVEKDFKCLTERPNEDESDNYEHPLEHH